jgi:hypothetical protein
LFCDLLPRQFLGLVRTIGEHVVLIENRVNECVGLLMADQGPGQLAGPGI